MGTLIPLIDLNSLPDGRGRRVCKAGFDLALFRIDDAVYAIEDSCPHSGGSLSNGKLQGKRVTCPVHGLKFNLEGVSQSGTPTLEVKKHAVHVVDGMVMLTTDEHSSNDHPTPIEKKYP
ncbi:Rieske 2Fe-2S domain-containing protein [Polaromonas sp. P1(28)-13]|nr:Rieske 2Fe-2S domain-containing protein [Polaromonas sp. P1(28)-13]